MNAIIHVLSLVITVWIMGAAMRQTHTLTIFAL